MANCRSQMHRAFCRACGMLRSSHDPERLQIHSAAHMGPSGDDQLDQIARNSS
jgi:hypothetical protein